MHTLLIGLISGYFFVACAPVHWNGLRLALLVGLFVVTLVLRYCLRCVRCGALTSCFGSKSPRAILYMTAQGLLNLFVGACAAAVLLAGYLHVWQTHGFARQSARVGCVSESGAERELVRLQVIGLPSRTADGSRFDAKVVSIRSGCRPLLGQRLRVSWKAATWPTAGQRILAQVRLRAIRGSVSVGAFDHELNLARRGIRFSAYLTRTLAVSEPRGFGLGALSMVMARARLAVRRDLQGLPLEHRGVLLALLTGDSALMPRERWELLQATGTVHLMVISGLHIGLVAIGLLLFVRAIGKVLTLLMTHLGRLSGRVRLGKWTRLGEALVATVLLAGYVMFTGAGVAAVRALIMLLVVLFAWSLGRHVAAPALLIVVFAAVVVSQPEAGLAAGFWLSFGLVSWLLLTGASVVNNTFLAVDRGMTHTPKETQKDAEDDELAAGWVTCWQRPLRQHVRRKGLLARQLLALHVGCSLILFPGLAWLGLPIAIVSPIANLVAVPVVTLLLVPLVLCGGALIPVSADFSVWVFDLADSVASGVLWGLGFLARVAPIVELPVLTGLGYCAFGVILLAILLPSPSFVRFAASAVIAVAGWNIAVTQPSADSGTDKQQRLPSPLRAPWTGLTRLPSKKIESGQFLLQLLDVGQGLSVVIQTKSQTLLYDTGARFPSGFNLADAVVVPALRALGVSSLDVLVISHHDLDHAGGLETIAALYKPSRLLGGVAGSNCNSDGQPLVWRVDGVRFKVVQHSGGRSSNDRSCVLVIRGSSKSAVITGDIEADAERVLLSRLPRDIDVLVVPHHGSKTSSTPAFVAALRPKFALVSAGFGNRFGHPHSTVVRRYERVGAGVLNTAELGTIEWRSQDSPIEFVSARQLRQQRWQLGAGLLH